MMDTRGKVHQFGLAACVGLLVLSLTGCGDDESDPKSAGSLGPLAEFLGYEDYSGEEYEFTEEDRQAHYAMQESVVECMNDLGFEYYPEPFWGDQDESFYRDANEDIWRLQWEEPEEFARQYGYGITTITYDDDSVETPGDEREDPNWEYQQSLSEAAQQEYEHALWGDWSQFDDEDWEEADGPMMPDPPGCYDQASQEQHGGEEKWERFDDLHDAMGKIWEQTEQDPRMTEARQTWTSCMADAGYPGLEDQHGGQDLVNERQSELYGWDDWDWDEPAEGEEYREPPEPDPAAVAQVREFELEVAWADYTCRQEAQLDQIEQEIRFALEEQFIEDHRAELEEYREFLREEGAVG